MREVLRLNDATGALDNLEASLQPVDNPTRIFTPRSPKEGEFVPFESVDFDLIPTGIAILVAERIQAVCPQLLTSYQTGDGEVESIFHDDRLDIRVDRFSTPHQNATEQPKKVQLAIIKDTAVLHYQGVTLAPSLKSYKMGEKIASLTPPNSRVLEIGTGSGIIGLSMLNHADSTVMLTATDIDSNVLNVAEISAEINGLSAQCNFVQSDLYRSLGSHAFNLIVCNPPFMPSHIAKKPPKPLGFCQDLGPQMALDGGASGLEIYERIMIEAEENLLPKGKFVFRTQPRVAPLVRELAQRALGRRFKQSYVLAENKIKHQAAAKGFMVVIEVE